MWNIWHHKMLESLYIDNDCQREHTPPPSAPSLFLQTVFFPPLKDSLSRAAWVCQLPACLLSASSLSSSPSSCPLPSSLSSSLPPLLWLQACNTSIRQPPDRELTWTLDTVPARLTRLFAQSRVDNSSGGSSSSSSTITSAGADHVCNRGGFNAVTTDAGGGKAEHSYLSLHIPHS